MKYTPIFFKNNHNSNAVIGRGPIVEIHVCRSTIKTLQIQTIYKQSLKNWSLIKQTKLINNSSPYQIAINTIKNNLPATAAIINDILEASAKRTDEVSISISQDRLEELLKIPRLEFANLNKETTKSKKFIESIGTVRDEKCVAGVYIWTHLQTGNKYVGSSSTLARRLIGYFKGTHADIGKFIPLLRKEGLNAFKLQVIPITSENSYTKFEELCLEQYFLLDPKFNLNTLIVVNKISGMPYFSLLKIMKNNYQPLLLSNGFSRSRRLKGISLNKRFYSNNLPPVALYDPVVVYTNVDLQMKQILEENKGKSGIYIWTNKGNGKFYIGSGVDLKTRLKRYLSLNYLEGRIKLGQSHIYSAILNHGHSNFKLEILEYCHKSEVLAREQYYLDLLKPEYNILQIAGSTLGYKHSEEAKNKIRSTLLGKSSGENNPMFGLLGEKHPRFGGTHSDEFKFKLRELRSIAVEVLDEDTGVISIYPSMKKAAEALGCSGGLLTKMLKKSNLALEKERLLVNR